MVSQVIISHLYINMFVMKQLINDGLFLHARFEEREERTTHVVKKEFTKLEGEVPTT